MPSFQFTTGQAEISGVYGNHREFKIEFTASDSDLLDQIDIKDAVSHYGKEELLDLIGDDFCKEYFGLTEAE